MLGSIGTFRCPTPGCSRICFYHLVIIGWLLHYPQPLPCLHYPPKPSLAHTIICFTFPLIPRPQLLDWWLSAWEPLPLKKWTKNFDQHQLARTSSTSTPMYLTSGLVFDGSNHCVTQIPFRIPLNDFYGAGTTVFLRHFRVLIANAFPFKFHLTIFRLLVLYVFTASWRLGLKIVK